MMTGKWRSGLRSGSMVAALCLTACLQEHGAPIEYRGDWFFGRNGTIDSSGTELPKYSAENPAILPGNQEAKYRDDFQQYGAPAEVTSVAAADLPPPGEAPPAEVQESAVTSAPLAAGEPASTTTTAAMPAAPAWSATPPSSASATVQAAPAAPAATASASSGSEDGSWLSSILDNSAKEESAHVPPPEPGRTPSPADAKKREMLASADAKAPVSTAVTATKAPTEFIWPIRGTVLSGFQQKQGTGSNDGINIAARSGEPVRAAADGVVVYADNTIKTYGNMVIVKHPGGWLSAYAHASELVVKKGDEVIKGQLIGFIGQTGNVTQPQLHFSLRHDKMPVDPQKYLVNK